MDNIVLCNTDCILAMRQMPENYVDAIITDPPYGLEFMGKEWDKFESDRQRWEGTDRKLIGDGSGKGGDFGERFNEMPKSIPKKNKKCKTCGHYFFSGTPCKCETPDWEVDNQYVHAFQDFCHEWATEALRVLKPGGHLLSFGGSRTYHRMACAIEDAGFEIRDQIMWLYGSGFPKSLNIGKAIDKTQGNEREVVGIRTDGKATNSGSGCYQMNDGKDTSMKRVYEETKGNTEWEGWGTALKPAHEPIVLARKPLSEKTVAENVLKWGVGGLAIDNCRITHNEPEWHTKRQPRSEDITFSKKTCGFNSENTTLASANPLGRFPANLVLSHTPDCVEGNCAPDCPIRLLDEQAPKTGAFAPVKSGQKAWGGEIYGKFKQAGDDGKSFHKDGLAGASRFFYCAKASKKERDMGCGESEEEKTKARANNHPTVKPIALMKYLVTLVTKEGQTVLDPFMGSGTTGMACKAINRKFIGIEKEKEYFNIAKCRIEATNG